MKVGLIVPLAEDEYHGQPPTFAQTRAMALRAEAAGFDSVWVYDHLLHRFPGKPTVGFWEAWTVLAALADATTGVELGTTVLCAAFRNPAVLAKMAVTLDEVSQGRLILGLGAVPALVAVLLRAKMPESPRWLLHKGRVTDAVNALDRLGISVTEQEARETADELAAREQIGRAHV